MKVTRAIIRPGRRGGEPTLSASDQSNVASFAQVGIIGVLFGPGNGALHLLIG